MTRPHRTRAVGGRRLGLVVALTMLVASSAGPAFAEQVTEEPPNDDITQAFGPLANGVSYDGQFETVNDFDWLYFYVSGARQVQVRVTKVEAGCSADIVASIRGIDGTAVAEDLKIESNSTSLLKFTTTATGRYYIVLSSDCVGDPYRVEVGPPEAITTDPPPGDELPTPAPQPTGEPNETIAAAAGPLAAGTAYGGDFSSLNDRDWFVFYVTGALQTRVAVTKVGLGCSADIDAAVRDPDGLLQDYSAVASDTTTTFAFITPMAGRYYVTLANDCIGDPYQVRVGPPEAITVSSPFAAFAPTLTPAPTREPNDTPAKAFRVMGGIAYGASIDGDGDVDYFRFVAADARDVDVAVTKVGDGCGGGLNTTLRQEGVPETTFSSEQSADRDTTVHHQFRPEGTSAYLLKVTGTCTGDPYQLRVDPADAILGDAALPDAAGAPGGSSGDTCPKTAGASSDACRRKVSPSRMKLVVLPGRDARQPFRFRAAGSIALPAGLSRAAACSGRVTIRFRRGVRTIAIANTFLRGDCTYGHAFSFPDRLSFPRARILSVKATFGGNALLRSATHSTVVRVR